MVRQRIQGLMVLVLMCLVAGPAWAEDGDQAREAAFELRTGARVATTDADTGDRTHARFRGEGDGTFSSDGVSLELGVLTQVEGDSTLTITPNGDFERRGRSRVFIGTGSAVIDRDGEQIEFANVRIMVKLRGKGARLRMIGKVKGVNRIDDGDADAPTPADVLHGVFRGQRVAAESAE